MNAITAETVRPEVIELRWNHEGKILVTPENDDRMVMTTQEAVKACHAYSDAIRFDRQFKLLIQHLADWIRRFQSRISRTYLTVRDSGLLFVVVQTSCEYDAELDNALTELDVEIGNDNDFHMIRLNVMALPAASLASIQSFLASRAAIELEVKSGG